MVVLPKLGARRAKAGRSCPQARNGGGPGQADVGGRCTQGPHRPTVGATRQSYPRSQAGHRQSGASDASLNAAVSDLISTLETNDVDGFVQNYIAPNIVSTALAAAERRMPADMTPEIRAQVEQQMQLQAPKMIEQITQQMKQNPQAMQQYQQLAAALKPVQDFPEMNAAGDQATYKLDSGNTPGMPPVLVMSLHDGKWTLDFAAMARQQLSQGN